MKCPNDNNELRIADRQGIEIDYCPECRGVWLDRGELDKLIERSMQYMAPPAPAMPEAAPAPQVQQPYQPYGYPEQQQTYPADYGRRYDDDDKYDDRHRGQGRKRTRESFLGELFDFD